ncbi:MAG: FIST C-terminal domain-containing protein [Nitrospiraceae bacterium]|nr:FIST C-terminal domain-containing protein [Nitrospiraceae bacterium]
MTTSFQYYESAGSSKAREQLAAWRSEHPEMGLLALVTEADREQEIPAIQEACARLSLPVIGSVFPSVIFQSRFLRRGVNLFRFDAMPFHLLRSSADASGESWPESLGKDIACRVGESRGGALFLIFDQMVPNIATILDGLYLSLADRVRYLGVNAGSETFRPIPCLFDSTRIAQGGAIALLLDNHPGAVVEHCYQAPERLVSATATEGNRIITIDWRPAFEVYRETVRSEYGVVIDGSNFYQYAVHFPFGIVRAGNEIIVRIPVALQPDGSLFCVGEIPPNSVLTLLRAPEVDSVRTVDALVQGLKNLCGDPAGADILAFYCAGRKIHLGDRADWELAQLGNRSGAANVAGALSLGEIGHSLQWGYPLFHNGALVCCRWG